MKEFGITKAIDECEAELRPKMPGGSAKVSATLRPVFVDEDLTLLRELGKPKDGREPLVLVLSRLPPEDGDDLKAGMELDDDYS